MANLDSVPSSVAMWRAYAFAPAATPLVFIAMLAAVDIVLPASAIAAGIAICYLVAGLIGMPIAFFLRHLNALNGYTIHGAAFCWGILSSVVWTAYAISVAAAIGGTWDAVPLVAARFSAIIIPPVVLAGTAFWLLLRTMTADGLDFNPQDAPPLADPETADKSGKGHPRG